MSVLYNAFDGDLYTYQLDIIKKILFSNDNLNIRSFRQSGMSTLSLLTAVHMANTKSNTDIMYVRSYNVVKPDIDLILSNLIIPVQQVTSKFIRLQNGSRIMFSTSYNFEINVRGHKFDSVIFDSLEMSSPSLVEQCLYVVHDLMKYNGTRIISFSTGTFGLYNSIFYALNRHDKFVSLEYPYYMNPKYDILWYSSQINKLGNNLFSRYYL